MVDKSRLLKMVQFSILLAIEALFCFTVLGSLPAIGPIVATLGMVPVVLTALLLGTKAGTLMGFFAGLFSFLVWTFMPPSPVTAFLFTPFYSMGDFKGGFGSVLICFVPRILVGTVAGLVYTGMKKSYPEKQILSYSVSAVLGSLVNTVGVLGGIWLFYGSQYETLAGKIMIVAIGATILTSGIPEAIICAVLASAVCKPVSILLSKTATN